MKNIPIKKKKENSKHELGSLYCRKEIGGEIGDVQMGTYLLYLRLIKLAMCIYV